MLTNGGIYLIVNRTNGHIYIGSTNSFKSRWRNHRWMLNKGIHHSPRLQRAWDRDGENSFAFIIERWCSLEDLVVLEQEVMDSMVPEYNISRVAGNYTSLTTISEERKDQLRQRNRDRSRRFDGLTVAEWCVKHGNVVSLATALSRVREGWDVVKATSKVPTVKVSGLKVMCAERGNIVSANTAARRINRYGWSIEDAVSTPAIYRGQKGTKNG